MTSQMTENMLCAICQDTMNEPVTALCGAHNFCKACLTAHIETSTSSQTYAQHGYHGYYGGSTPPGPLCPTCRVPIQSHPSQLHVNCALRDLIASAHPPPSSASAPSVKAKAAAAPIRVTANRIAGTNKLHLQLLVPAEAEDTTMPVLVIPVIDNSGSMGNSSVDDKQLGTDAAAFSRSDLVRHAVNTQIELLREEDEMALVLFDNNATVALEPTRMTAAGRSAAKAKTHTIGPNGGTSIWAGLQKALTIAARPSSAGKNIVIILQTDGESDPSLNPPRGVPATFKAFLDAHPEVKITLHTIGYGFGRALDMALLRELAQIGGGTANYVPDGSMVGTVFIHLLANLMTCQYRGVKLQIPDHGICIPVGYLQADAPRNFVIDLPDDSEIGEVVVTANNTPAVFTTAVLGSSTTAEAAWPLAKDRLCTDLRVALTRGASFELGTLIAFLYSLTADARIAAVLSDLMDPDKYKGQMGKAFETAVAFERWGQHYMSGVLCGLENEWPINFKDATSATFGSPSGATRRLIDRGDEIFNALPPPTASCARHSSTFGGGRGPYVPPVSMASINTASGGCFLGASRVRMLDGGEKRCDEIQPGDVEFTGRIISKVIKMHVPYADIVRLSDRFRPEGAPPAEGGFTPWHPVFPDCGVWTHPADLGPVERVQTDAVYNFVLAYAKPPSGLTRPGTLFVDGMTACTLGHDYTGPVIGHPYFGKKEVGKRNILEDLAELPGWAEGYITIKNGRFLNDPDTGFICGLIAE